MKDKDARSKIEAIDERVYKNKKESPMDDRAKKGNTPVYHKVPKEKKYHKVPEDKSGWKMRSFKIYTDVKSGKISTTDED